VLIKTYGLAMSNENIKPNENSADQRAYIQLTGPDSRKFLQGQVTCDMETLTGDTTIKGAHCNAKGRIIFLFSASCDQQDNITLEMHQSIKEIAMASLKKYAVFFKTEISDISDQYSNTDVPSNLQRIRTGSADVLASTSDMFIPQMLNLDALGYISFKKGCYTGQEIVARAHYRGAVKRRMHHLRVSLPTLPDAGDEIRNSEGKSIGNIASAAWADPSSIELLAVLSDKYSDCTDMQVGEQPLTAVTYLPLPYEIPASP
jgi:folate-binding protein YgfZ